MAEAAKDPLALQKLQNRMQRWGVNYGSTYQREGDECVYKVWNDVVSGPKCEILNEKVTLSEIMKVMIRPKPGTGCLGEAKTRDIKISGGCIRPRHGCEPF
jgi:hypothetical protein